MLILPFLTKQFELNLKCSYRDTIILLKKNVEDHMKGKEDQQICMEESDWDIGGKTGVSSGERLKKKADVLQTSDNETSIGKDYDRRKGGW